MFQENAAADMHGLSRQSLLVSYLFGCWTVSLWLQCLPALVMCRAMVRGLLGCVIV